MDNVYWFVLWAFLGMFLIVVGFLVLFFRGRDRFLSEQRAKETIKLEQEKLLLQSIIQSQDEERVRIGRDLHDDIGTALAHINVLMETLFRLGNTGEAAAPIRLNLREIITDTGKRVRAISHNLSPEILTIQTTCEAIISLLNRLTNSFQVQIDVEEVVITPLNTLNQSAAIALYRIIEELTGNTVKHAGADNIKLKITLEQNNICVHYTDNGKGITRGEPQKKGRGIKNMESRIAFLGASFTLPEIEKGFEIFISIPFNINTIFR